MRKKILKCLDLPVSKEKFTGDITKDLLAIREILIHIPAEFANVKYMSCLLYTSPSPRD